jgi:hypothetical protein
MFQDIIDDVRRQLSDSGTRIAAAPLYFRSAWWPDPGRDILKFRAELMSDYGVPTGPKEITDDFYAEVKAIEECLDRLEHGPNDAEPEKTTEWMARRIMESANQRATALSVWEKIAFPLRLRGNSVFHVVAPSNILGTPIVEAMPADEFIRLVSMQTIYDKVEIARLQQRLNWWKLAGAVAACVLLLFGLSIWSHH